MTAYGFDISPYLAGPCDAAALRKLVYSERFTRVILAIDTGNDFFDWINKVSLLEPIKQIDVYRELTTPDRYRVEIDNVRQALVSIPHGIVLNVWLTFENTSSLPTVEQIWDAITYARQRCEGYIDGEVGIYTGSWYWVGELGNPQIGYDVPLWDANYEAGVDFDVEYGGWLRATVRQIEGNYKSYGLNVDVDVWDE